MTEKKYLKKAMFWATFFLCLFPGGSTSMLLSDQSAGYIHSEYMASTGLNTKDFSVNLLLNQSTVRTKKVGSKLSKSSRSVHPGVTRKVTASWYGAEHHNKSTASGQRFNMYNNTLAHKTLPLGTKVRLVNPKSGRSVEGIVSDRGPYINGRDVDISYEMAKELGFVEKGVMKLNLEVI